MENRKVSSLMEISTIPKSDQVNADWFISGPKTYTIERVAANESNKDQPVNIWLAGVNVPYRPSKSMRRVFIAIFGPDANTYTGKRITLYNDPEVQFGGLKVGGIKISHMSGLEKPTSIMLTSSRSKRAPHLVKPLTEEKELSSNDKMDRNIDVEEAMKSARDAAEQGRSEFQRWWRENSDLRSVVQPIMDELRATVEEREGLNHAE